jgi:hypothetical protein
MPEPPLQRPTPHAATERQPRLKTGHSQSPLTPTRCDADPDLRATHSLSIPSQFDKRPQRCLSDQRPSVEISLPE